MSSHRIASRAEFDQAIALIGSGRADQAERVCRGVLERNPHDVNMRGLLGAVLLKRGRLTDAEEALRTVIEQAPTFAKPHEDLGLVLLALDRPEAAVEALERATGLDPSLEMAFLNLGRALATLGRAAEADEAFEASFALNPERKALAAAAELHRDGRAEEAEQVYRQVLRRNPKNVDALRLLGMIAFQSGRMDEADRLLRRALEQAPDFVGCLVDRGRVLKEQSRYQEAVECFEHAAALEPGSAATQFLLAATYAPTGRTYEALRAYERTLELRPKHAGALLGLGHVLKTTGRQSEAIDAYRRCIALRPDNGESYWSLANLKTYRLSDEDIQEIEARVHADSVSDQSRVNFLFSLAKAWEDREDYERAWSCYERGNSTQRMLESYDPVQTEFIHDAIERVFDRDLLHRHANRGHPDAAPIFVVGLPRSGSTLIEQVLATHSQVEGTSELPYLGRVATSLNRNRADGLNYPEAVRELDASHLSALGQDYLDLAAIHRSEGTPRFVDKMPNNFPTIGFAHLILPNARIVDARRHPVDACLGCFRQLFARGQSFTYDLTDIGEYYLQYQRMMDHWHAVLPGRVHTIQYEEMVSDPERQIRDLIDYCGLPWEAECLNFHQTERPVRTASSEQVRQPIYASSVGFWHHYEAQLGELLEVLEPVLGRYERWSRAPAPIAPV